MFLSQAQTSGSIIFTLVPGIVFIPLAGLLINMIFGKRFSEGVIGAIASGASGLAFVIAVLQWAALLSHPEGAVIPLLQWIDIGDLHLHWAFNVDTLSVTMMLVVSGVGTLIHIYAIGYMHEDVRHNGDPARFRRFFVYLNLFIAFMMILVSADNYIMLFVGWEGVGLCSYLLIGFWYEKGKDGIGNALAAKKAMVVNRIGDFGFLISAFLMYGAFHTFEFKAVFEKAPEVAKTQPGVILAITLFMLVGVTGKSAQLPLYVWLPDAMAGPTPVSALIHAATMVTAGVYLIARSHVLYMQVPAAQNTVAWVGGLTALFAATIAVGQFDIKKVLAYSTISQLGFMVAAVGMGAFTAGMFHLVTHAFFKALLFLSAGSVIQGMEHGEHVIEHDPNLKKSLKGHSHFDPQDMRNMGGLRNRMKITFWVYLAGAGALAGIPPLAGFWSKDEILASGASLNFGVYLLLTLAAFFTAFYMGRQVWMVFMGSPRTAVAEHAKENPPVMTYPLIVLAVLSVLGGALNLPFGGLEFFSRWLEHTLEGVHEIGPNLVVATLAIVLALLGVLVAYWLYDRRAAAMQSLPAAKRPDDPLKAYIGPAFTVFENKYWVDELYNLLFVRSYRGLARILSLGEAEAAETTLVQDWLHNTVILGSYRGLTNLIALTIDLGFIDATANALATVTKWASARLRRVQTGFVRNYALAVFLGVVVIIGYLLFALK